MMTVKEAAWYVRWKNASSSEILILILILNLKEAIGEEEEVGELGIWGFGEYL